MKNFFMINESSMDFALIVSQTKVAHVAQSSYYSLISELNQAQEQISMFQIESCANTETQQI